MKIISLEHSYLVYGQVTESGTPVENATVYATGTASTDYTTTDASGNYVLDLQNVADANGDTITIRANYSGYNTDSSFTLDISGTAEEVNIALDKPEPSDSVGVQDSLVGIADKIESLSDTMGVGDGSTLGTEADKTGFLDNGEVIAVWDDTNYKWIAHLQGTTINQNQAINKWDVGYTRIVDDKTWNQAS